MRYRGGIFFHFLCALSLCLAAAVAWSWHLSFQSESHLASQSYRGQRLTLRSKSGEFILARFPQPVKDDAVARSLVATMNNTDIDWTSGPAGYVEGRVRTQTPTSQLWQHLRQRERFGESTLNRLHLSLAAMEDPQRFVPAHFLLLLAAQEQRKTYFHRTQSWSEANISVDGQDLKETPLLFMRGDSSGAQPDLGNWEEIRQEWHDVLDQPTFAIFHGWIFLGAMILPFAWIARPRSRQPTFRRSAFNFLAVTSSFFCIAAIAIWITTHQHPQQRVFASSPPQLKPGWNSPFVVTRWITSSNGQLILEEREAPETGSPAFSPLPKGHQEMPVSTVLNVAGANLLVKPPAQGDQHYKIPGLEYFSVPAQVLAQAQAPRPRVMQLSWFLGMRSLTISWWLLVLLMAILPMFWLWGATVWWTRVRRDRVKGKITCRACGYDIRATPDLCPECGTPTQAAANVS